MVAAILLFFIFYLHKREALFGARPKAGALLASSKAGTDYQIVLHGDK